MSADVSDTRDSCGSVACRLAGRFCHVLDASRARDVRAHDSAHTQPVQARYLGLSGYSHPFVPCVCRCQLLARLAMCTSLDIAVPARQAFDAKWCNVIARRQAVACTGVSSVDSS